MPLHNEEVQKTLFFIVLGAVGGIIGYLNRALAANRSIKWGVAALEGVTSAFFGYLFLLLCREMALSYQVTGLVVGFSGWIGAAASVKILDKFISKRLGIADENPFVKEYKDDDRRDQG